MTLEEAQKDMENRGLTYLGLVAFDPVSNGLSFYFKDGLTQERGHALVLKAIPTARFFAREI